MITDAFLTTLSPEQVTESKVVHADIYTSGAVVEYRGTAKLSAGRNKVLLKGISKKVDVARIQIRFLGGISSCHLLGRETYLVDQTPEEISLTEEIAELENEGEALQIQYEAWKTAVSNTLMDSTASGVSSFIEALPEKLKTNRSRKRFVEALLKEKQAALHDLQSQSPDTSEGQVTVVAAEITAEADGLYPFSLTTEDSFTHWTPYYELSVENTESPVKAKLRASIRQYEPVDWERISLNLLYGSMRREGTKPTLNPLQVSFYAPRPRPVSESRRSPYMGQMMGMGMAMAGAKAMAMEDTAVEDFDAAPAAQAEEVHEMLAQYRLPDTYTIKANTETVIDVLDQSLPVEYQYSTVPKLMPAVYLTATLKDPSKARLLACEAYVYYQQTNIGKVQVPEVSAGEPFVLSLGKESALVIDRTAVADDHSESLLKGTQARKQTFEIELLNRKNTPVNVQISDQIPLSKEEKIKVEALELSGGSVDAETGEVKWDVKDLEPGKSRKLKLVYQITYPKNTKLDLKTSAAPRNASRSVSSDTVRFCPSCGDTVPLGNAYCPTCGYKL